MTPREQLDYTYPFHIFRKVAIVIPAYNEEKLIGKTIGSVPEWVSCIIVIDDASTDKTRQAVAVWEERDSRIIYERLDENQGVGFAITTGYDIAKKIGCDIAVVMAGDAQMDPDDLESLIYPIITNLAGYVKGDRLSHPDAYKMPLIRRIGSTILARLTSAAAGIKPLHDMQCGYTALDLKYYPLLKLDTLYRRYGYPNDMILRLARARVTIKEVPVRAIYAKEKSGFLPHQVILPITRILANGYLERVKAG